MKPKTRLNLVLIVAAVLSILLAAGLLKGNLRHATLQASEREARLQMEAAQAVRRYTSEQVATLVAREGLEFDPAIVPTIAAEATMKLFAREMPGSHYREVAFNPANEQHLAQGWQAELLRDLRRRGGGSLLRMSTEGGQDVMRYASAVKVDSPLCLNCHGQASDRPLAMQARYGLRGMGWKMNEVVGAQIVTIPLAAAHERLRPAYELSLLTTSAVLAIVFLTLNLMLHRLVMQPSEARSAVLRRLALRDSLTGAANRRRFMDDLHRRMAESDGQGLPLSVVMVDLDHFKAINDRHGHAVGDQVLAATVQRLRKRTRKGDLIGRLGGEEFAVLLPDTDATGACTQAEQLLQVLLGQPFDPVGAVSASLGVAQWDGQESAATFLMRADAALYLAKHSGRCRVVVAPDILPPVSGMQAPGLT